MTTINIFRHAENVESFIAGQTIFTADQPGDVMYVVIDGEVDIIINNSVIETVGAGGIVGEMALIDNSPRSATAIAKTDCRLAPVNKKHFTFLVQQTPYFALQVMEVLANRLRQGNKVYGRSDPLQASDQQIA